MPSIFETLLKKVSYHHSSTSLQNSAKNVTKESKTCLTCVQKLQYFKTCSKPVNTLGKE